MDAYVQGAQRTVDRVVGELGEMCEMMRDVRVSNSDFCGILWYRGGGRMWKDPRARQILIETSRNIL